MKKAVFTLTILALVAVLAACGKTGATTGSSETSDALSMQVELLIGTIKLEDTDLAVSADQAMQLLPLWRTLQALSASSTTATEEINAVVDQIKSTMTSEQMDKIDAMELSQQDIMSITRQVGASPNDTSTSATPMARNGFPSGDGPQGGGPQGGGGMPPGGASAGGGMPGGGNIPGGDGDSGMVGGPMDASGTPQAVRPEGMGNQLSPSLLNALIELLLKKIN
jgi:hypothetical protein